MTEDSRVARRWSARADVLTALSCVLALALLASGCRAVDLGAVGASGSMRHVAAPGARPTDDAISGVVRHAARASPTRAAYAPPKSRAPAAADAPNVVVILTDDMRWDDLRYLEQTQRLLVRRGMTFPRAISPHPLCCPARATLFTGAYAQNHGVHDNAGPLGRYPAYVRGGNLPNSIGPWFTDAGYDTALVGKHINKYQDAPGPPRDPGWTYWNPLTWGVVRYSDFSFWDGTTYRDDYVTGRIEDKAEEAIDHLGSSRRPFYLQVNHVAPHFRRERGRVLPPLPEQRYARSFRTAGAPRRKSPAFNAERPGSPRRPVSEQDVKAELRARVQALRSVDDAVADLVRKLDAEGLLDETYVVFTSDNGYDLGEFRHIGKNRLNNVDIRVPLVVRGPGIAPGTRSPKPASTVDVAATVIGLVGARTTRPVDGLDLTPTLNGGRQRWRDATLIQTGLRHRNLSGGYWRTRGVLTDRYLLARDYQRPGRSVLYDHRRDPHELHDVYDDPRYRAVRKELLGWLAELARCRGVGACNRRFDPLPRPKR